MRHFLRFSTFSIFNVLHMMGRMLLCAFCRCNSCISHKRYFFYCPLGRDRPGIFSFSFHLCPLDVGWVTWAWPFQWQLLLLGIELAWLASGSWEWQVLCRVLPGKDDVGTICRHSIAGWFQSTGHRHCKQTRPQCCRKSPKANGQSCAGSCMLLWLCPDCQLLLWWSYNPGSFVASCLLLCSEMHLCALYSLQEHSCFSLGSMKQLLLSQWKQILKNAEVCPASSEFHWEVLAYFFWLFPTWSAFSSEVHFQGGRM